jgi:phosphomannomutase
MGCVNFNPKDPVFQSFIAIIISMLKDADPTIFRAYDIRGVYPSQIDEDTAYLVGKAYATLLLSENRQADKLKVAVGSDMRVSSPALKERLIEGLLETGLDVDDLGLVSTPTYYFAVAYFGYDGGLQVSASHNPGEWNGFKMTRRNSAPVSGDSGIMDIRKIISERDFASVAHRGSLGSRQDALAAATAAQTAGFDAATIKPFVIAVDAANGMGSLDMAALFEKLPCRMIPLNFELNGTFPAHEADPMKPQNREFLAKAVVEHGADLGIAPDGDGDRYFFIDEKGETIPQSIFFGLMAQLELESQPDAVIPCDVRPARIATDLIQAAGGRVKAVPAGSAMIKEVMIRDDAIFSGEPTGHYFYKLPYGTFEAPILLVLKFLRLLSRSGVPASELVAPHKKYFHSGDVNVRVADREEFKRKLAKLKKDYADGKQNEIDGLSVEYPDYWFNVRASNTEPLLRINVESRSQEVLDKEVARLKELLTVLA